MKKRILVLIMAILCLSLVFVFASCGGGGGDDGDDGTCQHTFGEWDVITPKTCVASGLQKRACSLCGEEESESIPAGHSFGEWNVTDEPDCTSDGSQTRTCTVCTDSETERIITQGHKKKVTTAAKEPTATENGCTEAAVCEKCGETISESQILVAYTNVATPDKTTVISGEDWKSFSNNKKYLFDGNVATAPYAPKGNYKLSIELNENAYILEVIVTCNGSGKAYNEYGATDETDVARVASVTITCYKDGKEVISKTVEDTTALKEVKLEGINTNIDTIEISVKCVDDYMWGNGYLWEINAYGTYTQTTCEAYGHDWGEWEETKAPVCTYEDELTDGEKERVCGVCGEVDKDKVTAAHEYSDWGKLANGDSFVTREPACGVNGQEGRECVKCYHEEYREIPMTQPHSWGEWNIENVDCENGGEKKRQCTNAGCGKIETIIVPAGEHANVITEGYIAPTTEADGATGKTYCTVCGEVISSSKVITKLVNHSSSATVGTDGGWAIDGATGSPDTRPYLVDGNMNTGMTGYNAMREVNHSLTWANAVTVNKIKLYFSGDTTGKNVGELSSNLNNTNPDGTLTVTIYGADSRAISSETIRTKDITEYTIDLEENTQITKINIKMKIDWNRDIIVNIWEVEALTGGEVTDVEICEHDWNEWEEVTSAACGVDGLKQRDCKLCPEVEEEVIPAPTQHVWGEWSNSEGFNCATGGTRERTCTNTGCGKKDTETVEPGEHIELVTEGYVAPTTEAEGSTGTTKCTACGQIVSETKVISKLVNVASGATVEMLDNFWATNNAGGMLIDGNPNTGVGNATNITTHSVRINFAETAKINKLVFVVNSTGNIKDLGTFDTLTNNDYKLYFKLFDAEGNVVYTSGDYQTLDVSEIEVELADGIEAKYIEVYRFKQAYGTATNCALWEVTAISGGEIVE